MPDPKKAQVPPTKDPNELPDLGPAQSDPPTSPTPPPPAPVQTSPDTSAAASIPSPDVISSTPEVPSGENNSGMGSGGDVPPGVHGWGWGPFFFTWIWGVFNGTWISLIALIPIGPIGLIMAIVLGINGRKWAWQNKKWRSVEHFNEVQRKWSIAGLIFAAIFLLLFFLWFVVFIVALVQSDLTIESGSY